jgi:uncharacterized protein (DUF924 family)
MTLCVGASARYTNRSRHVTTTSSWSILTALAAIIVFDQMSRNMFRDTPSAYAADRRALSIAQEAIARGFDVGLSKDERMFLYLPFEHAEDAEAQARCVTLMATLDDPELVKWADAHRSIIVRFGRFPHRFSQSA